MHTAGAWKLWCGLGIVHDSCGYSCVSMLCKLIDIQFKKLFRQCKKTTTTSYSLHIDIWKTWFYVFSNKSKYCNIVNCGILFQSEVEKMKCWKKGLEAANDRKQTVVGLATFVCSAARGNCTFNEQESPQNENCNGVRNHYAMSTCTSLVCAFIIARIYFRRVGTQS